MWTLSIYVEYILCRLAINKEVKLSFLLTQAHRSGKERVRYVNIDDSLFMQWTFIFVAVLFERTSKDVYLRISAEMRHSNDMLVLSFISDWRQRNEVY
jgi:hypothetical protein